MGRRQLPFFPMLTHVRCVMARAPHDVCPKGMGKPRPVLIGGAARAWPRLTLMYTLLGLLSGRIFTFLPSASRESTCSVLNVQPVCARTQRRSVIAARNGMRTRRRCPCDRSATTGMPPKTSTV